MTESAKISAVEAVKSKQKWWMHTSSNLMS